MSVRRRVAVAEKVVVEKVVVEHVVVEKPVKASHEKCLNCLYVFVKKMVFVLVGPHVPPSVLLLFLLLLLKKIILNFKILIKNNILRL